MEYFVGAAITMLAYLIARKFIRKELEEKEDALKITYNQSHIYEMMAPYLKYSPPLEEFVPRQSDNFLQNAYMKVMIVKDKAYWIKDNVFYVADVVQGQVAKAEARKVDTMAMSKVELEEMMFIVEKLREDNNDNRGSGKS
jgi:hypothetical protein